MIDFLVTSFPLEKNRKCEEYLRKRLEKERDRHIKENTPYFLFWFVRFNKDKDLNELTNVLINTIETTIEDNIENIKDILERTNSEVVYYE